MIRICDIRYEVEQFRIIFCQAFYPQLLRGSIFYKFVNTGVSGGLPAGYVSCNMGVMRVRDGCGAGVVVIYDKIVIYKKWCKGSLQKVLSTTYCTFPIQKWSSLGSQQSLYPQWPEEQCWCIHWKGLHSQPVSEVLSHEADLFARFSNLGARNTRKLNYLNKTRLTAVLCAE